MTKNQAKNNRKSMARNARVMYWERILGDEMLDVVFGDEWNKFLELEAGIYDEPKYSPSDIDEYVKANYADKLKKPGVMARILGCKED